MSLLHADHSLTSRADRLAGCFVADRTRHVRLDGLGPPYAPGFGPGRFRHCSLLLAIADPVQGAVALCQLAGVARRIVLWPRDEPLSRMADIIDTAEIDTVITEWALPGSQAGQSADRVAAEAVSATEWVLLTSGTTGRPKLVVHSLGSLSGHLERGAPAESGIVWCTFYDVCRYGGLQILLRALTGGGSLLLPMPAEPLDDFLAWAAEEGATHFLGTPTHWRKVLMSPSAVALHPRYIRLSGEIVDQAILDRLHRAYPAARLVHAFASTEAGLAFEVEDGRAGVPPEMLDRPWRPDITIRLAGGGSLQVRSAGAARGYLGAGAIRPISAPDGFVDTGDTLVLRDGRLHFDGRRDHVVNIGGRKVHPARVEAVINDHPAVRMSRVQGRASPIMGALIAAEVVCGPGQAGGQTAPDGEMLALTRDIVAFCRTRLAAHEVPATIRIVASLAVAPSGKLERSHA